MNNFGVAVAGIIIVRWCIWSCHLSVSLSLSLSVTAVVVKCRLNHTSHIPLNTCYSFAYAITPRCACAQSGVMFLLFAGLISQQKL